MFYGVKIIREKNILYSPKAKSRMLTRVNRKIMKFCKTSFAWTKELIRAFFCSVCRA